MHETNKKAKNAFQLANPFLDAGCYYRPFGTTQFKKIDKKNIRIILYFITFRLYFNKKSAGNDNLKKYMNQSVDCLKFSFGCGKVVLIIENIVFGFYNTEKAFLHSKKNYENYYKSFNYPCITNISFIDEMKCIVMSRAFGQCYSDSYHDKIVIKQLIALSTFASIKAGSDGTALFLQHGDANRKNIIWDEDKPIFIDLDNINYYPPLLDVFHYLCLADYFLEEIVAFLKENEDQVKVIAKRSGIDTEANYIDELLYHYVKYYAEMNCSFEDLAFLKTDNTKEYPKTNQIIRSISHDGKRS